MQNRNRYLAIATLSLMLGLMLRSCLQRNKPVTNNTVLSSDTLPSTDTLRVGIHGRNIEIQTPTGVTNEYVPEEGKAVIEVPKSGAPKVTVTNKGLASQFGFSLAFADKLRLGVDYEFAYFNRFGFVVGVGFNSNPIAVGYGGVTYQLDQLHLTNTSLLLGYTSRKDILVGLRMAF